MKIVKDLVLLIEIESVVVDNPRGSAHVFLLSMIWHCCVTYCWAMDFGGQVAKFRRFVLESIDSPWASKQRKSFIHTL
jgi:hypothetical protein